MPISNTTAQGIRDAAMAKRLIRLQGMTLAQWARDQHPNVVPVPLDRLQQEHDMTDSIQRCRKTLIEVQSLLADLHRPGQQTDAAVIAEEAAHAAFRAEMDRVMAALIGCGEADFLEWLAIARRSAQRFQLALDMCRELASPPSPPAAQP